MIPDDETEFEPPPTKPRRGDKSASVLRRHKREIARLVAHHDQLADRVGSLIADVATLKEVADATAALERLGRITERLIAMERDALGLDRPGDSLGADFAELLTKAWERMHGTPPRP